MTKPTQPFVRVVWHDAADYKKSWASNEEAEAFAGQPVECVSVGWLLKKTRSYITLAADYSPPNSPEETEDWGRLTKIPRKMITQLEQEEQKPDEIS